MEHHDGHPPDEILLAQCQRGDFSSFEIIYQRYQRPILAYLYQLVRDYEDAGNLAQDVFLRVFEHVGSFDTNRKFSTWFYAIARNAALDFLSSRARRSNVSLSGMTDDDSNEPGLPAPNLEAIESTLARAESTTILRQALDELPPVHREVIELVVFQEKSYEEASEILGGVSTGTLRSRMFHALRRLRTRLEGVGGADGRNLA